MAEPKMPTIPGMNVNMAPAGLPPEGHSIVNTVAPQFAEERALLEELDKEVKEFDAEDGMSDVYAKYRNVFAGMTPKTSAYYKHVLATKRLVAGIKDQDNKALFIVLRKILLQLRLLNEK